MLEEKKARSPAVGARLESSTANLLEDYNYCEEVGEQGGRYLREVEARQTFSSRRFATMQTVLRGETAQKLSPEEREDRRR